MTNPTNTEHDERIAELLSERLEGPLDAKKREELERLLAEHPEWRRYDLDFAAAAVHMALEPHGIEEMPDDVKARLIGKFVGDATRPAPLRLAHSVETTRTLASGAPATQGRPRARSIAMVAPWLAAAAAVVVAIVGWSDRFGAGGQGAGLDVAAVERAPDAVKVAWAQTPDPLGKNVTGDVVWSASTQQGFMRFQGLPANDPTKAQYQLWIFDAERDDRYPVDGGVFDIPASTKDANGDVIVPIRAKIPVGKVAMFAVTLERPGGVVVSTRERLVALGKVG